MNYQVCDTKLTLNIRKDLEQNLWGLYGDHSNPKSITVIVDGKVWVQGEAVLTSIDNPLSVSACWEYKSCAATLSVCERVHTPNIDPYEKVPFTAGDIDYE